MDVFSRKVVGWQVYETESSDLASEVMRDLCKRENIAPDQVVLHSDNGSPMKGATMPELVFGFENPIKRRFRGDVLSAIG